MALTKEDLQSIGDLMDSKLAAGLEPIRADIAMMKEDIDQIKKVAVKVDHEVIPRISSLYDGHKLNSEKLDTIQKSLDDIVPTVLALDVLHQASQPTK